MSNHKQSPDLFGCFVISMVLTSAAMGCSLLMNPFVYYMVYANKRTSDDK